MIESKNSLGVFENSIPEVVLNEWEKKNNLHTQHVNISTADDVVGNLKDHKMDCFVSMEERRNEKSGEADVLPILNIGSADAYFAINKDRSDLKEELDSAMRRITNDNPFYKMSQSQHSDEGWIYQELSIRDNGIGMSEEFQKHIFDLFAREHSTTSSGIPGTGLGMGITKKLIDLMNGTITVKSKVGEGTTVTVKIPMRIASFEDTQPKHSNISEEKERLQGKHILLAEDNDLNAEIAITLLEEEGLQVDRAKDGVECVKKLEHSKSDYYELILMDIQMPSMNGYEATEKIRKLHDKKKAEIPIIAMTAKAFSEDKEKAAVAGMNDHVAKPVDMDILIATMLKYIRK